MNVGNVGTQDYAAQAAPRRESPPSTPPVEASAQGADPKGAASVSTKPAQDTVTLTGNGQPSQTNPQQPTNANGQPLPALNPELRADYTVSEAGDLVVRIIDEKSDQVVRQIPDEEQQRIREAIAKATQEQTAPSTTKPEPANAAKAAQEPIPVLGDGSSEAKRAELLGEKGAQTTPTPEAQTIGSQAKSSASETQYAAQGRTAEGQETNTPRNGAAQSSSQEGANGFREAASALETSGAVQGQTQSGATGNDGDGADNENSEARDGTFREAALAAQFAGSGGGRPGQVVNVTG